MLISHTHPLVYRCPVFVSTFISFKSYPYKIFFIECYFFGAYAQCHLGSEADVALGLPPPLVLVLLRWVSPGGQGSVGPPALTARSSQAQQETQKAALRYERAVSMHNAAREMVFVAEQGVMADKNRLDPTWQEMLNHATCKVSKEVPAGLLGVGCFLCSPFIPSASCLISLLHSSLSSASILFQAKPLPCSLPCLGFASAPGEV